MKKVIVYAYINKNLGDDLFIDILCQRYPHVQFQLMVMNQADTTFTEKIPNLVVKHLSQSKIKFFWNVVAWNNLTGKHGQLLSDLVPEKKELQDADAVIYVGGSLFMEPTDTRLLAAEQWRKRIAYAKKFYILGCNFGPYSTQSYVDTYADVFSNATDVCMRDEKSANLFADVESVRLSTDIVLGMNPEKIEKEKLCVISVIELANRSELDGQREAYKKVIQEYAKELLAQKYTLQFISFCEPQGDLAIIKEIIKELNLTKEESNNVKIYDYQANLEEALKLFERAELVIATRFHAMILALVNNAKVLPIVYSQKMTNVLDDVNFKGPLVHISQLTHSDIESSKNNIKELIQSEVLDVSDIQKLAQKQFEKLDELLNR